MRAWLLAVILACVAAPALAQSAPATRPASDGAPLVSREQNGQSVSAVVGKAVTVELESAAPAGARWVVKSKPDFLADAHQFDVAVGGRRPTANAAAPDFQMFVFPVRGVGSGALTLEKHDPAGATVDTFTITVTATAHSASVRDR
ncbi:MAG: hypothetical protein QM759_14670 [Terricaulis sp.]